MAEFDLPPWLAQSNTDLLPNAIAKGTSAGESVASGIRARRQQGFNEQQRAIENDLQRKQVEAIMDMRGAQAAAARAKLDQAASFAASQRQGWDNVNNTMAQLDEANKADPLWHSQKRAQALQDQIWNNQHLIYAGHPEIQQKVQASKMQNETRQAIGEAQAEAKKKAAEEATARAAAGNASREKISGNKIGSNEFIWDMRLGSAEARAAEANASRENIAGGNTVSREQIAANKLSETTRHNQATEAIRSKLVDTKLTGPSGGKTLSESDWVNRHLNIAIPMMPPPDAKKGETESTRISKATETLQTIYREKLAKNADGTPAPSTEVKPILKFERKAGQLKQVQ